MTPTGERLNEANACHDDDAPRAAALLRALDAAALAADERPLYAYLLNHVIGEKLGDWADAHRRQQALDAAAGGASAPVLWRQAAVAARLAGEAEAERAATRRLAQAGGVDPAQAEQLVALAAVSFTASRMASHDAALHLLAVLPSFEHGAAWQRAGPLDAAAAACCNNVSVELSERPLADLVIAPLRAAMARSAELAQLLWGRAGTWVHHERAWYQRAVVANTLGEPDRAREHARAGLALLDAHDAANEQSVDRAFLELELAHACGRLGLADEAFAARERAAALEAAFDDEGVKRWFASRVERLRSLAPQN